MFTRQNTLYGNQILKLTIFVCQIKFHIKVFSTICYVSMELWWSFVQDDSGKGISIIYSMYEGSIIRSSSGCNLGTAEVGDWPSLLLWAGHVFQYQAPWGNGLEWYRGPGESDGRCRGPTPASEVGWENH